VAVYGDLLLAGASPLSIRDSGKKDAPPAVQRNAPYASASESLVVMDRHSGKVLWQRRADQVFRHNAIAAGGGLIFCIDALSKTSQELLKPGAAAGAGGPHGRGALAGGHPGVRHVAGLLRGA
jgi:hypothetical protein